MTNLPSKSSDSFAEIKPLLARDEALTEANRCLFCYDAPCIRACPTSIDIPGFIKKIASGNLLGSARTILRSNILGASCARVCPTEVLCEGACVLHDLHKRPIEIGRLQRYSTDPVVLGGQTLFSPAPSNGKSIAVVGAGPAGLGCAAELRQLGYRVTVFEASDKPGGLNTYGVADYKMDAATSLQEIAWLQQLGVEIRYHTTVGSDISIEQLLSDHDALFLGVGLGKVPPLGIPGESLPGSEDVLDFIAALKLQPKANLSLQGRSVAVLGGGNTSIDGVTQAIRLGASKVYLVYRRGPDEMPAYDHEIQLAKLDGVTFVFFAQPVAIEGSSHVTGLRCQRTRLTEPDPQGRRQIEVLPDSDFVLHVDRVFRATGQEKRRSFFASIPLLQTDSSGRLRIDSSGHTDHPKIWAGGDCTNGGKEVVNAVAEGKRAALDIHRSLSR